MTRQIAILLTNTDRSAFAARHPNDGEKIAARMRALRPDWTYRIWRACDGDLPPGTQGLDGVLISGSPASVNDDDAWIAASAAFVRTLHQRRVPTIGLCFGHQLIAKALGGRVERAPAWGLGVGRVHFDATRPWMTPPQAQLCLYAVHQDQVTQLPEGAERLGGDPFCPIGSFTVGQHMLTVQYHPEMPRDFLRELLEHLKDAVPAPAWARARAQVDEAVDADLFFQWMVNFLEMPRSPSGN